MNLFVTGIDTEIGKTIVSSILVESLGWNYWKPVQSGELDNSDTHKVERYTSKEVTFYPEGFRLNNPLSPHASAKIDGVEIQLSDFELPQQNDLIIEGAGGLMVPLNEKGDYVADLIPDCNAEVILVVKNYLGSINHTLLSIDYLKQRNISIKGIIITGDANIESETVIQSNTGIRILHHVRWVEEITPGFIQEQAAIVRNLLA